MIFNRKTIVVITSLFALVLIVLFILVNSKDKAIDIVNFDSFIKDMPKSTKDAIKESLYAGVASNLPKNSNITIDDAMIRDKSTNESYDSETDVTKGGMIVDISNINQSYSVSYEYSDDPKNEYIRGEAFVKCLPKSDLIYGEFNCTDMFLEQNAPLKDALPVIDVSAPFKMIYLNGDDNRDEIAITTSTKAGRAKALSWLRERGIDPTDIVIHYFDFNNEFLGYEIDY